MSQTRLHRTELLDTLEAELDTAGFKYREKCGRKHGRILVDVNGKEEPIFVSGTPSDHRAIKNAVGHLRRKIREWKGEMKPQRVDVHQDSHEPNFDLITPRNSEIGEYQVQSVNARDLHAFLRVGKDFSTWIKDRIEQYAFMDGTDFAKFEDLRSPISGSAKSRVQTAIEYAITLDMAKELSMVERNEMGSKARRYFIECEKQLREQQSTRAIAVRDDDAILDLIVAGNQDVISAQSRSAQDLLEHVEGGKAAVLRYLKMYVRETLDGMSASYTEHRKSLQKHNQALAVRMDGLEKRVTTLLHAAEQPLLSRPFVWDDWYDHDRIYREFFPDRVIPNRRFLSSALTKSLDAYCKRRQRGFDMQSRQVAGRNVNMWHKDSVTPWMSIHGQDMIRAFISKQSKEGNVIDLRSRK